MSSEPNAGGPPAGMKAADYAGQRDWPGYFRAMLGKPPRETLVKALDLFDAEFARGVRPDAGPRLADAPPTAIDLGCGEGRDTLELLRRGWRVLAVDGHPMGIELLLSRVEPAWRERLEVAVCDFPETPWRRVDLVNASFCLPFCPPGDFPLVWAGAAHSVRPGGRFAGQFFGPKDSWARLPDRSHHTRGEVEALLAGFDLEERREEERDDVTCDGQPKHWHVFHIVARKAPGPGPNNHRGFAPASGPGTGGS